MKHPFYPFLLSALPVSLLLAGNLVQLAATDLLHPALAMLLLTGVLMGWFWLALQDWNRAAWLTMLALALLNYHVMLWLIIPGAAALLYWKAPVEKKNITFNLISLVLLAVPLGYIGGRAWMRNPPRVRQAAAAGLGEQARPDIYFIILDSYTSHQVLLDRFGYDNSDFLQFLQGLGFATGDCSSSYDNTAWSLSATLDQGRTSQDYWRIWPELQHNQVRMRLESQGYRTVAFQTGFDWSEWRDADIFIRAPLLLNDYDVYYLSQTLLGKIPAFQRLFTETWNGHYRLRLENTLQKLPQIAELPGSKFVFVHLLAPHPPFVFNADGSAAGGYFLRNLAWDGKDEAQRPEYLPAVYAAGYTGELSYIDRVLPGVLRDVLANSVTEPIIIVQGDHGAWYSEGWQRYAILCAVHNPPGWQVPLEPEHTFDFVFEEK
jgi:hypothetical protein